MMYIRSFVIIGVGIQNLMGDTQTKWWSRKLTFVVFKIRRIKKLK
jgi:hypothetical protein